MQLRLPFSRHPPGPDAPFLIEGRAIRVEFVRHPRARHYILGVRDGGSLRVTIPRGGSRAEAERFVGERRAWIERQWRRQTREAAAQQPWTDGTAIALRGLETTLSVVPGGDHVVVAFADQTMKLPGVAAADLQPYVERHLRRIAARELPGRLAALAAQHGFDVAGVSIRNQRTRWGACSPAGRITLNWRLVQFPPAVSDYVMLHELAHLRHLNHSRRFWREVARVCPWHEEARVWLRAHRRSGDGGAPAHDSRLTTED